MGTPGAATFLAVLVLIGSPAGAAELPEPAQALLDAARAANPQRFQYALDHGARILPTADGRSFYLLWYPHGGSGRGRNLVATLHGSASWAFDEFFLWRQEAESAGFGILALQWWMGGGEGPQDYYAPADLHRELREALRAERIREGSALLHGFSRGGANLYGVAALDRQSQDRFYAMFLANAGGASADFPPNLAITRGDRGFDVFSGTYWAWFCGGRDPNPERGGCPAMRRTAEWVADRGGATDLFLEDAAAGHGGFHQTPAHTRAALEAFRRNLALRTNSTLAGAVWEVRRDAGFALPNASIPNVGWVRDEVWLVVGTNAGSRLFRSRDGANASTAEPLPFSAAAMAGSGYVATETLPRQDRDGHAVFYVLGLAPPGVHRAVVFRLTPGDGGYRRDPAGPVFEGAPEDAPFIGVPDVTETADGKLRLTYVARGAARANSRTAISTGGGASFSVEFRNPFGDFGLPDPRATDLNVDPAVLRLARGGYLAVTMRGARLFLFTSVDGRTFTPANQPAIEPEDLWPGASGLFDPTLVQLPDGRIFMYATAGADPGGASRVVRAELARRAPKLTYKSTLQMNTGTIRPELLIAGSGEFVLVVAEPEGRAAGLAKHLAYRFTADWQPIGPPFVVTRITEEFGEPADHRALLVNDELVVVYQSLLWREPPPPGGGGPAEVYAKDQSLLLARFTLDGAEILRRPLVAHAADMRADNFPDFCLLDRGRDLLVSTGSLGGKLKIRKVDWEADVLESVEFPNTEESVPDNIGNSFLADAGRLWMLSATGPHRGAALTLTELSPELQPSRPVVLEEAGREQHFPVSALAADDWVYVAYESRPRGGGGGPEQNPYAPYLKILTPDFRVAADLRMGAAGVMAVHPCVVRAGNRIFFAWSASVPLGARTAPRVQVDEYEIEP